ncbi:MAG: haloacid dehalogenase-like hydrolase [Verrucomicrobiota bacterium]|nr:haloacid dehalogenase-like hydrolase [Verrucomicrobiota bacterium]
MTASNAFLQPLNWDPFNKAQIEALINSRGRPAAGYDPAKPPYAVFDWDNTSIFLDIEEAVLAYQIQHLVFKATPELLNAAIRKDIGTGDFAAEFNTLDGASVRIGELAPDIIESYTWLYDHYAGLRGNQTLQEVSRSPHFLAFASKLRYLYEAIGGTFDHSVSYPWVTYLFAGMTEDDVRRLTRQTVEWQLTQPVGKVTWQTPEALPGRAGRVAVSWKNGLRLVPEMQNLYRTLRENGFDVWVCSASFVDVVREVSSNPAYGYANPEDHVYAMELARDESGRIRAQFRAGYDQTQGAGKTKTIRRFLVSKYGYGPAFVAGDSEGDQNMMRDFEDTRLSLIVNRLRSPATDIGRFSKQAVDTYRGQNVRFLLQGRDENTGLFIPSQASRPLGGDALKVLSCEGS